jgi:hypothetical protein
MIPQVGPISGAGFRRVFQRTRGRGAPVGGGPRPSADELLCAAARGELIIPAARRARASSNYARFARRGGRVEARAPRALARRSDARRPQALAVREKIQ